jgi:hypothetical protein
MYNAQLTYRIIGFDRIQFVSDLTDAIPQDGSYQLAGLRFECDGVRASGCLTVQFSEEKKAIPLDQRLRAVRGVVSVSEVDNLPRINSRPPVSTRCQG